MICKISSLSAHPCSLPLPAGWSTCRGSRHVNSARFDLSDRSNTLDLTRHRNCTLGGQTCLPWLLARNSKHIRHVCRAGASIPSDIPKDCERSNLINQELILFIFQIDLDQSLQRALNYESYPTAQQIRTKREEVDMAVKQLQAAKGEGAGARGGAQSVVVDVAAEGLRLRSELQRAVEEERYSDAAQLRDQLNQLVNLSRVAEAAVQEAETPVLLRLGERVKHKLLGWRGVVVGWDVGCCEGDRWKDNSRATELTNGLRQPFYHILVDQNDWRSSTYPDPPVAYVAQERLTCPRLDNDTTWLQENGPEPLEHPYAYVLFLGQDAEGNLLPCRQLRDKFAVVRRDVFPPGADDSSSTEEDDDDDRR